jgi:hypothetical protein
MTPFVAMRSGIVTVAESTNSTATRSRRRTP